MISNIYPLEPGHKRRRTSKAAAESMTCEAPVLREKCLALLQSEDLTADEIAERLNRSILSIRPRISELNEMSLISDSGMRRKNASGRSAIVWTCRIENAS